ncbi:MAG: glycosyltransferase family 39 protein, partial [Phycisphaerales bacterium]
MHKKNFNIDVLLIVLTIILAGAVFGLGKYFELNTPGAFDSGAYVYSAAHIINGAKIGVEEKPSAQLGTLLVNMLGVKLFGYNELGPEIIQTLLQAAALVMMFIAMRKLYCTLAAIIGTFIATFYLSAPLIAKFGNVKEQYMIAFMVISMSCFVLYQLNNKWLYAVAAGAFASWAPLFKPTGMTVIGAIGIFVLLQPLFKNRTIKQTGIDIILLFAGAALAIAPLYIWILGWHVALSLPYSFIWQTIAKIIPSGAQAIPGQTGGYVESGRKLVPFSQQWPMVLRYYSLLILPIGLSLASIIARLIKLVFPRTNKTEKTSDLKYDRFVLLLSAWWILDMAFVWISPRSYEQYYLPLNASAAMLSGYIVTLYSEKLNRTNQKLRWRTIGCIGLILMTAMGWHIFFGIKTSPYSGRSYGQKTKGYTQKLQEISYRLKNNSKSPWETLGEYIRQNSTSDDRIYVWGWWPGIYVQAQRFSSASKAFMMPRPAPAKLAESIEQLLSEFEKEPPKFIVDSRKRHIPTDRPPYELWPIVPKGFMGFKQTIPLPASNESVIEQYDRQWEKLLREKYGDDEADRYTALKPLRRFIMTNYRIVAPFGQHILFELK